MELSIYDENIVIKDIQFENYYFSVLVFLKYIMIYIGIFMMFRKRI